MSPPSLAPLLLLICLSEWALLTTAKALQFSNTDDADEPTTNMLTLPNGCLCCSVKDLGIAAIEDMVAAQREKIDWVVVELTGLADPGELSERRGCRREEDAADPSADREELLVQRRNGRPRARQCRVRRRLEECAQGKSTWWEQALFLCLCPPCPPSPCPTAHTQQIDEQRPDDAPNECQKQIACADIILLNKTDLVTPPILDEVSAAVAAINPTLRVHRTERAQIPLEALFNVRAYTAPPPAEAALACCEAEDHALSHGDSHDHAAHAHAHGEHAHGITTTTIPLPTLSQKQFDALNDFLEEFLWAGKVDKWEGELPEILRTKGYLEIEGGGEKVVQGVADLFEIRDVSNAAARGEGEKVSPKLVFIGRRVDGRLGEVVRARLGL